MPSSRFWSSIVLGACTLMLAGCGLSQPGSLTPIRPVGGGGLHAQAAELHLGALDVLERTHEAALQADAKAAFVSMVGQRIDATGTPLQGGFWRVEYLGSPLPNSGSAGNPYANKRFRRLVVTVDAQGQLAVEAAEQDGLPLGVCLLQHPMPALDSSEALRAAKRARPGELMAVVDKMTLTSQMSPQHQPRLVWKFPSMLQGQARSLTLDANTGEIVTSTAPRP